MSLHTNIWRNSLLAVVLSFFTCGVHAQIHITFPSERAVFQRSDNNSAVVSVSGSFDSELDKIEVRAIAAKATQGTDVAWKMLTDAPKGGTFTGTITLSGGWYQLEVRGSLGGKVVYEDKISKMGVGEVFIISGQSNAQGVDLRTEFPLPPGASDDRVNYINYNNKFQNSLSDPPAPAFAQLQLQDSVHVLGPIGTTAWCWGILGDLLAQKMNVPVLFINTAWSGTSIHNWVLSSRNQPTTSVYSDTYVFPEQMPYGNLRMAVQHYASQYGARAILWMLGESDNFPVKMGFDEFKSELEYLIKKLSADTGSKISWVISRTSRIADASGVSITSPAIIAAQNAVIRDLVDTAFNGPETDDLPITRVDGTHFYGNEALAVLANAWNNILSPNFVTSIKPVKGLQIPAISIDCEGDNNSVKLSLPDRFNNYIWTVERDGNVSEQSGRTLNVWEPGTYSARVKDELGNTIRTQKIVIRSAIRPSVPGIMQEGRQQICADSSITLQVRAGSDKFHWYKGDASETVQTGKTFAVSQSGEYVVRAENVLGCYSERSAPATVLVRKVPETPSITKIGPFNITLTTQRQNDNIDLLWKRDQQIMTASTDTVAADKPGIYTARFARTFELDGNSLTCYSTASNEIRIDEAQVADIVMFPNPVYSGELHIESKEYVEEAEVTVYDTFGRILIAQKYSFGRRVTIPLSKLSTGTYIVRIKSADLDVKKQVVVR